MAKLRYCTLCKREVEARKGFNWLAFLFLAGIPYLLFYLFKRRRCPICGGKEHLVKSSLVDGDTYVDINPGAKLSGR